MTDFKLLIDPDLTVDFLRILKTCLFVGKFAVKKWFKRFNNHSFCFLQNVIICLQQLINKTVL